MQSDDGLAEFDSQVAEQQKALMATLKGTPDVAAAVLLAGEQRRVSTDSMMWQVPALTLTAQSFLLTIVLGSSATRAGAAIAAAVGVVIAMGALRQMLKHRYHEEALSRWLETLEESLGLPTLHDVRRAGAMLAVAENRNPIKNRWLRSVRNGGRPAFEVWARLLVLLAIVDATLGILSIVGVLHSHG